MTQEEISAILGEEKSSIIVDKDISIEEDVFDTIKSVPSAIAYAIKKYLYPDLLKEYVDAPAGSYSAKVAAYRIVVAVLTNNEKRYLTTGERWFPIVQFCEPGKEKNCSGKKVIGKIESEGKQYTVVGDAYYGVNAGLGGFYSDYGVSYADVDIGFRTVSSERVAKHISKYFGKLLFEIHYGGINCDWKWVN